MNERQRLTIDIDDRTAEVLKELSEIKVLGLTSAEVASWIISSWLWQENKTGQVVLRKYKG
jgi:hypothetical protein